VISKGCYRHDVCVRRREYAVACEKKQSLSYKLSLVGMHIELYLSFCCLNISKNSKVNQRISIE